MPLSKKDIAPEGQAPVDEDLENAIKAGTKDDPRNEEHPGDLTPGMYAEEKVGQFEGEPGTPEANEHGERFLAAKMQQRLGTVPEEKKKK